MSDTGAMAETNKEEPRRVTAGDGQSTAWIAPPMGAVFVCENQTYRVTGWLRPAQRPRRSNGFNSVLDNILFDACQKCGPNNERLVFCARHEAVYVCGAGAAGIIAGRDEVRVTGMVNWEPEMLNREEREYRSQIGEVIF